MKHKHHIIPKHAGGTDDSNNIIELSVEEHAEAHRVLYEQFNRWQDYYAWQGLSGQIDKSILIKKIQSIANNGPKSEETKKKMSLAFTGRKYKPEFGENIRIKMIQRHKDGKYDYEKMRLSRIGHKQSDSQKQKVSEKLSKEWNITSPTGNIINIKNLRQFCKDNNLDQGNMCRGKYKGWICRKVYN